MKTRFANIVGKARALESRIASTVEETARKLTGTGALQPLEIAQAIVDDVEREIQPSGRGQRVFPFNNLRVFIVAASRRTRAYLEAICEGPPSLEQRVADRLAAAGCPAPGLVVRTVFVPAPRPDWSRPEYHLEFARSPTAAPLPAAALPQLELTVTSGDTEKSSYVFAGDCLAIGRGVEVRDRRQRLLRINHVVFREDGGDVNQSVSRRHAHIHLDRQTFRIIDDGSAQGTNVIRNGRGLDVPRGSRGLALQSGDELVLGQARVRVTLSRQAP